MADRCHLEPRLSAKTKANCFPINAKFQQMKHVNITTDDIQESKNAEWFRLS